MPENPRILIAYFSYSGNTEHAAELIQQKTGADLVEIEMENPYSGNIYEVSQADLNQNIRPALRTHVENMEQYDVILLGYAGGIIGLNQEKPKNQGFALI